MANILRLSPRCADTFPKWLSKDYNLARGSYLINSQHNFTTKGLIDLFTMKEALWGQKASMSELVSS